MTTSFRPVIEKFGDSSSTFVSPADLEVIFIELVEKSFAGDIRISDYDEQRSIWIEEGFKFLDYINSKGTAFLASLGDGDSWDQPDLESLFGNMKALATDWQSLIKEDGSLTFYIDQY